MRTRSNAVRGHMFAARPCSWTIHGRQSARPTTSFSSAFPVAEGETVQVNMTILSELSGFQSGGGGGTYCCCCWPRQGEECHLIARHAANCCSLDEVWRFSSLLTFNLCQIPALAQQALKFIITMRWDFAQLRLQRRCHEAQEPDQDLW